MNIDISELEYCKFNVRFEADIEKVKEKKVEVIQQFKDVSVPGFRQGKAPMDVIKLHFKDKINEMLTQEMARLAYETSITERNLKPFGEPQFTSIKLDGNNFECNFVLHSFPEFELKEYKGFNIPKAQLPDPIEMGEKIVQELRVQNGETVPFDDNEFVENGNNVIVNYKCYAEDTNELLLEKEGELFTIGKSVIQEINENLLGMKVGETREFVSVIPNNEELANKSGKFVVELVAGSKTIPAPLTDELAHKLGARNIDELKEMAYSMGSSRVETLNQRHLMDQVAYRLIENHEIKLPDWLILVEAKAIAKNHGAEWEAMNDGDKEQILGMATKTVKVSLILNKIREQEIDAQLTDEEVSRILRQRIDSSYPEGEREKVLEELVKSNQVYLICSSIRDEFVLNFIIKSSTIVE